MSEAAEAPPILSERRGAVGIVRFNRPEALNAFNRDLIAKLGDALESFDRDEEVRCMVLTGDQRAFAAGADIKEMAGLSPVDLERLNQFAQWDRVRNIRKPVIAAVNGYALGGGCEMAMACDMIVAGESARFGQPEINIGVIPGAGGTQRLTRAVGKARAMELVLTGRQLSAREAHAAGLVTKVVADEWVMNEALTLAEEIASRPPLAVMLAKQAVNKAFETSLREGLEFERKAFYLLFSSEDQKEGMAAFNEKRAPRWKGR
jgi:enoyl-CoA hydratase